jgi:nitrite reductase (NO-forming)
VKGITKDWAVAFAIIVIALVLGALLYSSQNPATNRGIEQSSDLQANKLRDILLVATEKVLMIAPDNDLYPGGLSHNVMTFNGTIPGPVIFSDQGDTLRITLKNEGNLVHSLNFHAGFGPSQALSGVVNAGKNQTWTVKVDYPGAFLYHCDGDNLNGIWEHIANGMYGGIVVRRSNELKAPQEFYVAFSEVYSTKAHPPFAVGQSTSDYFAQGPGSFDMEKFIARKPDLILTNGMAFRSIPWIGTEAKIQLNSNAEVFHVRTGELTKWYIFNAGPRNNIAFNFAAAMVKEVANNNDIADSGSSGLGSSLDRQNYRQGYDEVVNIPPGSGTMIEVTFPEPGTYFGNDHDVGSVLYGAGFVVIAE